MNKSIPLAADARERFLLEIAAAVEPARIAEGHFFPPLRQGQIETGVAVLAVRPVGALPDEEPVAETATDADAGQAEATSETDATMEAERSADADAPVAPADAPSEAAVAAPTMISSRHVVYSARYRWTRKGPDRGKWEAEVVAEADAPLLTVEAVVSGMKQRLAEPEDPTRVPGEVLRTQIAEARQRWQTNS